MKNGPELVKLRDLARSLMDTGEDDHEGRADFAFYAGVLQIDPLVLASWLRTDLAHAKHRFWWIEQYLRGRALESGWLCERCNRALPTPGVSCACQDGKGQ